MKLRIFFDKKSYELALRKAVGVFSDKLHLEWRSAWRIISWLRRSRLSDDRALASLSADPASQVLPADIF